VALDGLFLHFIRREIEARALGARVEKIAQPTREELILHLRGREGGRRLLISGGAMGPRIHFVAEPPENPKTPPMFCMLLRKHLAGARLAAVRQVGLDRILMLDFEGADELGDPAAFTIIIEIMGRHSNVIVTDGEGKILDAIRRVDITTSRVRQVLPGMRYVLPPGQDKLSLLEKSPEELVARIKSAKEQELSKAISDNLEGFSALTAREAAFYTGRGAEITNTAMTDEQAGRLGFYFRDAAGALQEERPAPTMVLEPDGRPRDVCCFAVRQYGAAMLTREYPDCSVLLERFYQDRDRAERLRQRSGDLLNLLASTSDRIARKLASQREELIACKDRDRLRERGDIISANLYAIQKGDNSATLQNFYDEAGGEVTIELDPMLTPAQNAQRCYGLYRKADTAEKHLTRLIAEGERELEYVDSVFDALTRADGEAELSAIRGELAASGYLRRASKGGVSAKSGPKPQKLTPLRFVSSDGFLILCGRNNIQNDRLTIKESEKTDLWLHTQKIPGSHVIVEAKGRQVPDSTIEQAAAIAAFHSKGRGSSRVPVDYTQVRNVRKPAGAKPGMVIYETYRTVIADPDEELVRSLRDNYTGPQ
jgi:predicted ribosome quality control (RQC) complex YloA/Tae2 family protein